MGAIVDQRPQKQTAFGITPGTVAGGTVKVKDLVKVEFDIALVK